MSLRGQLIRRFGGGLVVIAAAMFLLAGSLRFWQGWCFLILAWGLPFLFALWAAKQDPQLLERRLRIKEKSLQQMVFNLLGTGILFSTIGL